VAVRSKKINAMASPRLMRKIRVLINSVKFLKDGNDAFFLMLNQF
jgi:hypothetical protein